MSPGTGRIGQRPRSDQGEPGPRTGPSGQTCPSTPAPAPALTPAVTPAPAPAVTPALAPALALAPPAPPAPRVDHPLDPVSETAFGSSSPLGATRCCGSRWS